MDARARFTMPIDDIVLEDVALSGSRGCDARVTARRVAKRVGIVVRDARRGERGARHRGRRENDDDDEDEEEEEEDDDDEQEDFDDVLRALYRAFVRGDVGFVKARARNAPASDDEEEKEATCSEGGDDDDAVTFDEDARGQCETFEHFRARATEERTRVCAARRVRARELGIADEEGWDFRLTAPARAALARVAAGRERGATAKDVSAAVKSKSGDHLIKSLVAADLVVVRRASDGKASTTNVAVLKRYETESGASKFDYYEAMTRFLSARPNASALTKDVREALAKDFDSSDFLTGRTPKAKTKVFNTAKNELVQLGYIEPVLSAEGASALRLLKMYSASTSAAAGGIKPGASDDEGEGDEGEAVDASRWTGGGARGAFVAEQTFETQLAQRLRQGGSISVGDIVREYDVGPRTLEKRLMKMCDEDELVKRVTVQQGKQKLTRYASMRDEEALAEGTTAHDGKDVMMISDAQRRYDILLKELREEGFLYVSRLSSWLAGAEGGLYKRVDKKLIVALVDELVSNDEAFVHSLSWGITERLPDLILFHRDFPFDPLCDDEFIEALKKDIRSQEIADRQPLTAKLGVSETVAIAPFVKPIPSTSTSDGTMILAGDAAEPMDVGDRFGYRTLHNFHAIGLGYIKAGVVRLEVFHLYLVQRVFEERHERDGSIDPEILDDAMPISMYIRVINSVESRQIGVDDLEHIKREALLGKSVRDLPLELRNKLRSTYLMSRLTKRLTEMGLLHEQSRYDPGTRQIIMSLRMNKIARFQRKPGGVDEHDIDAWSEAFDLTTVESARVYWNALEEAFKGKPEMERASPATNMSYPRITSTRSWVRKWALGLDNCIILMNRLQEGWDCLMRLLLRSTDVQVVETELTPNLIAIAITELSKTGLPSEDALRVEQLAQDLGVPDDLSHIKCTWRDYCYAQICAASDAGIVSPLIASRARKMYARNSRLRFSSRAPYRAIFSQRENDFVDSTRPKRLPNIGDKSAKSTSASVAAAADSGDKAAYVDDSDGDLEHVQSERRRFEFKQAEDEFLVYTMIRFIALSGPSALRAEKRDYRAAVVYLDPMWRSRYPHVRKRLVVKRWRQLTVVEDNVDNDVNGDRHAAIVRAGTELYERGAKARRENVLPHTPTPTPKTDEEAARWDECWDCTGKWSEGIAKQALLATREIMQKFPVTYPVLKSDLPKSPRLARPKRARKVRRLRAGRELTEADDEIVLARLAPISFLRRRAITFQDESDDSDGDDDSDFDDDDSEFDDDDSGRPPPQLKDVPSHYFDALKAQLELLRVGGAETTKIVAPTGPQVFAIARALVDGAVSVSACAETSALGLPLAFAIDAATENHAHFLVTAPCAKGLHTVKIGVRDRDARDCDSIARIDAVGCLIADDIAVAILRDACARVIASHDCHGVDFCALLTELRSSHDAGAAARGAVGALAAKRAMDDLIIAGVVRARSPGDDRASVVYVIAASDVARANDGNDADACARAAASVIMCDPGVSESRVARALASKFSASDAVTALARLSSVGAISVRACETSASATPISFGKSTSASVDRFFYPAVGASLALDLFIPTTPRPMNAMEIEHRTVDVDHRT